jgi:hypothetical protein
MPREGDEKMHSEAAAISPEIAIKDRRPPEAPRRPRRSPARDTEGTWACPHLDLGLLAPTTVRH